ncbi:MAG: hypothetical protein JWM05_1792 [Acidimicrobiales bacterium]|nr:hypothetical protein [Acidimicrobiales bacterium]
MSSGLVTPSGFTFAVVDARAEPFAVGPTIVLRLRITATGAEPVHALALSCQVRIEPQRRTYTPDEEERLYELFGATPQWGASLRPFFWTQVSTMVTGFTGETEVDLPIACTYDLEVAGVRYLHGLRDGDIPLLLLFSGTAFGPGTGRGPFSARPLSWTDEAAYRLPVQVWRDMMDRYFPNSGWLRLHRDTLDELARYKAAWAFTTWEQAVERLLKEAERP